MRLLRNVLPQRRNQRGMRLVRSWRLYSQLGLPKPKKDGRPKIAEALLANAAGPRIRAFLGATGGDLSVETRTLLPAKRQSWPDHPINRLFEDSDIYLGALGNKATSPLRIIRYEDVCLLADGICFTIWRDNIVDKNSTAYFKALPSMRTSDAVKLDVAAFVDDRYKVTNPCHFMVDRLPRIHQFGSLAGIAQEHCATAIPPRTPYATFALERVAPRVQVLKTGTPYFVKTLYILSTNVEPKGHPFFYFNEDVMNWVVPSITRGLPKEPTGRKLYMSRLATSRRALTNEKALVARLKRRGFDILEMSNLSPRDQLAAVRESDIVVAPHGAALANVLGATSGTHVVELFNRSKGTAVYAGLSLVTGAAYSRVFGDADPTSNGYRWTIDLDAVEAAIDAEPQSPPSAGLIGSA